MIAAEPLGEQTNIRDGNAQGVLRVKTVSGHAFAVAGRAAALKPGKNALNLGFGIGAHTISSDLTRNHLSANPGARQGSGRNRDGIPRGAKMHRDRSDGAKGSESE